MTILALEGMFGDRHMNYDLCIKSINNNGLHAWSPFLCIILKLYSESTDKILIYQFRVFLKNPKAKLLN